MLHVYLVREAGTNSIHGVFWANSIPELFWLVDEMGDPGYFEFACLKGGGGLYTDRALDEVPPSVQWETVAEDAEVEEDYPMVPLEAQTESVMEAAGYQDKLNWRSFGDPTQYYG